MWQIKQSVSCTAYGSSLNVQFCERSKKKFVKQTIMWGRTRVRDKERARESKSVHARLPLGMSEKLWAVCQWIRKAHANTHTHTLPTEPEPLPETGLWVYWGDWEGAVPFCRANEAWIPKHKGMERVSIALLHPFTHFLPLHISWWGNAVSLKGIP